MTDRRAYRGAYGSADPVEESPLLHTWRVVRERWWVIAVTTVACIAAALGLALASQKEYEASSELLFRDSGLSAAVSGTELFEESTDPERDAATNAELVRSTEVAQLVIDDLGLEIGPVKLLDAVQIEPEGNTDLVVITARSLEADTAAQIANSFADNYVEFQRDRDLEQVREGLKLIDRRLAQLPAGASAQRGRLEEARHTLALLESVQTGNSEVAERAGVPSDAVTPNPRRNALLGFVFGLVLGVGLAFLLDLLDRRLKSVEDFERAYGVRALTAIPQGEFSGETTWDSAIEPYRILRSAIDYRSAWEPIKSLLITSAVAGEGKTTVAANLARSMAAGGHKVALVEADMRRPTLAKRFDQARTDVGLSTALAKGMSAAEVVSPTGLPSLALITSGPQPPDPSELLRGPRIGAFLREVMAEVDLMIVDASPLLPVADTQALLGLAEIDASIVVGRAFWTTRQDAERTRAIFKQHGREPIEIVVCGTREDKRGSKGYLATSEANS